MDGYDLAFLDPPYGKGLGDKALAILVAGLWLKPGAIAVLEERAGVDVALPVGITDIDRRSWGETEVRFLRRNG
jgi:16S rRNA (guanine966-N2)-methyltransferase